MVYRVKLGHAYKARVTDSEGRSIRASTGAYDEDSALRVMALVAELQERRGPFGRNVVRLIVSKRLSLVEVVRADEERTLDELVESAATPDLSPLVEQWKDAGANEKYVVQVRQLVKPGAVFPAANFRTRTLSKFLGKLPVSGSTKNRYRVALSMFARWLVEQEVIETNPVRDVRGAKTETPPPIWYERAEAQSLILALPEKYRAREAMMYGTGMEWQAIERLRRKDIDLRELTVHAQGAKNKFRNRLVRITDPFVLPIIERHLKTLLPNAPVFPGGEWMALKVHKDTAAALQLKTTTLHQWRHTYAVNWLREGGSPAALKRQLGHAPNSTLVERVYGVWIVDERDYQPLRKQK